MKHYLLFALLLASRAITAQAPAGYWQQHVEYQLDIRLDDQTHAVQGREKLKYFNNSPDTLRKVYFHLYWNAFQPNSALAKWAKRTADPFIDPKLFGLKPDEIGKQDIFSVQQNGSAVSFRVNETILEVELSRPLRPGDYDVIDIAWQGQVPVTIKRGGRGNASGVSYSFTQWYPKVCAYDRFGWHADPYIGREFYGEYGSFKVNITLPKKYSVAATGVLKNGNAVGFGYEDEGAKPPPNYGFVNVWKFEADNVHDFAWAADPEYTHDKIKVRKNLTLHFFYQPSPETTASFEKLKKFAVENLDFIESEFGPYLYPQFSFAQAGEWAMEYPMLTQIEKTGPNDGLIETAVHEWMHNWYYGMIGNNENDYPWMDEGFASYAASVIMGHAQPENTPALRRIAPDEVAKYPLQNTESMATPANLFKSSESYFYTSYSRAECFLWQLRYIVGDEAFKQGMLRYFGDWHFNHPTGDDFIRAMERASGMELDWFYAGWVKTTKSIDYGVEKVAADGASATIITLKNYGDLAMPAEVLVTFSDGATERHYIPLDLQLGSKKFSDAAVVSHDPWSFAADTYEIRLDKPRSNIQSVVIDPDRWTVDVNEENNRK